MLSGVPAARHRQPLGKVSFWYVDDNKDKDVPAISLECVMAASGLIEKMGRERLKPRKEDQQ